MATNRRKALFEYAFLTGDVETVINMLTAEAKARNRAIIARGPQPHDIKLAKMQKARGLPYRKWALGEK